MRKVVTPEQMGAADRAVIDSGTPSLNLMEEAGAAVARAALRLSGGAYGRRIVVVCGRGNNAGDGFVAARRLKARGAFPVIVLLEDPDSFSEDARQNFAGLRGVRTIRFEGPKLRRELARSEAAIDAIFGTGFRGTVEGPAAEAIEALNASRSPIVAVDIPSGVDGTTGGVSGLAVNARLTVTMGAIKTGLLLHPGCEHAGEIEVADIGVPEELIEASVWAVVEGDIASRLRPRSRTAHKRSVGTVLVVAGSVGMSGAAALTASGALRSGAGLVTIAAPSSVALELDQTVVEATTLPLPETPRGTIEASAVEAVLERASAAHAVAIGPGLSADPETVEFVRKLVEGLEAPLVIDADGINAFAGRAESLAARDAPTVLTPHAGELARLLGVGSEAIEQDRIGACREAAARTGAVVILKGFRSLVASPTGDVVVITTGGPALATGGTGDVLTGVVAALLAGGSNPFDAAWSAGWIHGRAGDLAAERLGERGVVSGDLLPIIPEVIRRLERER